MAARPRQLPLELGYLAAQSRDDFLAGRSNEAALAMVDRWPDWPSPVVVLAGPAGSGKTHLASIWRGKAGAATGSAAKVDGSLIGAAADGPVLVDDADAGTVDETGLFHLINAVRSAGTSLLMTARRFPASWGVTLPDLQSRLRAATTVEIHEPDDALLAAVVTKLFADRQIEIEPHVVQFLVRRMERSLATASAVVARIDALALERKARISRALAAEVVSEIENGR